MIMTLLLPWFPVVMAVGVGARLLGPMRGFAWSVLCSLFWVAIAGSISSDVVWNEPISFVALLAGVAAILAMGAWAGSMPLPTPPMKNQEADQPAMVVDTEIRSSDSFDKLAAMLEQFDEWLGEQTLDDAIWTKFDEFIRSALFHSCGAVRVRPYRMDGLERELVPLNETLGDWESQRIQSRSGIVGHVVTTGRSFASGDHQHGQLIADLARESKEPIAWCFPIRDRGTTIGLVVAREFRGSGQPGLGYLKIVELFVQQAWRSLADRQVRLSASRNDSATGLLAKRAFLELAAGAVSESYELGEPVTVAVFALEGMRSLNDSGKWDLADELAKDVADTLRRKMRADDRIGRFDGSRFIVLFRRVDSELASLIVRQLMDRLTGVCSESRRWGIDIHVRCGLAGSGSGQVGLDELVAGALTASQEARLTGEAVVTDLQRAVALGGERDED